MTPSHVPEYQYLKVVSNIAGVLPIARCVKRGLYIEGIVVALAYAISFMYHLSNLTTWDILIPLQKWHFLDRTFICITAAVLVLYLMDIKNLTYKSVLQILSSFLILAFGINYFLHVWMIAVLWLILAAAITGRIVYGKTSGYKRNETKLGIIFLIIAVVSSLCPYIVGDNTYWIFRSIWHVLSAVSIYFLLDAKCRSHERDDISQRNKFETV